MDFFISMVKKIFQWIQILNVKSTSLLCLFVRMTLCVRTCTYSYNLYVFVLNLYTFVRNSMHLCLKPNVHICVRVFSCFPFMCNEVEGAHKCVRIRNYWHKQKKVGVRAVRWVHSLLSPVMVLMYYALGHALVGKYQKRFFSVETTETSYKTRCT